MKTAIKTGQQVIIKPEFQDFGDDGLVWIAVEDEDGGRVRIEAKVGFPINPQYVVKVEWLQ